MIIVTKFARLVFKLNKYTIVVTLNSFVCIFDEILYKFTYKSKQVYIREPWQ